MEINWYIFPFKMQPHYLALSMSYNDLQKRWEYGGITERQYKWAMLFCCWSAVRCEGKAGKWQGRCYNSFGAAGVDKRIARIQNLKERYIKHHFSEYFKWTPNHASQSA